MAKDNHYVLGERCYEFVQSVLESNEPYTTPRQMLDLMKIVVTESEKRHGAEVSRAVLAALDRVEKANVDTFGDNAVDKVEAEIAKIREKPNEKP